MSYQREDAGKHENIYVNQTQPYILREDEKLPLFLIKLWNIVEDPSYIDVIRWDDSGYSFHITDPYSFCRNVLPQFFKHNNINSLIRQLNMYGFRKMTPIERTSLAHAESDQDHLEFSHPYFVRDHPELLVNIKRKVTVKHVNNEAGTITLPAKDLSSVFEELRQLRDRQKNMEFKMNEIIKENELVWQEMDHVRNAHLKQQKIVNKLVQFLVSLVHPNKQQRLGKRQILAIDEFHSKRFRENEDDNIIYNRNLNSSVSMGTMNTNDMLDSLINELANGGSIHFPPMTKKHSTSNNNGPIIADVTDELNQFQCDNNSGESSMNTGYVDDQTLLMSPNNSNQQQSIIVPPNNQIFCKQPLKNKNYYATSSLYTDGNASPTILSPNLSTTTRPITRFPSSNSGYNLKYPQSQQRFKNLPIQYKCVPTITSSNQTAKKNINESKFRYILPNSNSQMQSVAPFEHQVVFEPEKINFLQETLNFENKEEDNPIITVPLSNDSLNQTQSTSINSALSTISPVNKNNNLVNIDNTKGTQLIDKDPSLVVSATSIASPTPTQSSDPKITFENSPRNFNDYLSSINQSIDQCRTDIANHWDMMDLDNLLDSQEWQDLLNDELNNEQQSSFVESEEQLEDLDTSLNIPLETPKK